MLFLQKNAVNYIKDLIQQGEHQQLDFKFEISDAKKIARTFSAFANTDGGKLLIGVKDNGVISGIRTDEEDYMVESAAHLFCKPRIEYETKKWNVEGKWVLEVTIPPSEKKPHYAKNEEGKWLAYVRVKDANFLANGVLLDVWKAKNKPKGVYIRYGTEEKIILKLLKDSGSLITSELVQQTGIKKFILNRILAKLISIGLVEIEISENCARYSLGKVTEPNK